MCLTVKARIKAPLWCYNALPAVVCEGPWLAPAMHQPLAIDGVPSEAVERTQQAKQHASMATSHSMLWPLTATAG